MQRVWKRESIRDVACEYGAAVGGRDTEKNCMNIAEEDFWGIFIKYW